MCFFFQAEDGIRDYKVTGVQTCALPISVHNDGEVYGAIGWRMFELFGTSRVDELFGFLVDGMNYTPPSPTFEQMRDGILQSVAIGPASSGDDCRVWRAFAKYGVGVGARAIVGKRGMSITESSAVPQGCAAPEEVVAWILDHPGSSAPVASVRSATITRAPRSPLPRRDGRAV